MKETCRWKLTLSGSLTDNGLRKRRRRARSKSSCRAKSTNENGPKARYPPAIGLSPLDVHSVSDLKTLRVSSRRAQVLRIVRPPLPGQVSYRGPIEVYWSRPMEALRSPDVIARVTIFVVGKTPGTAELRLQFDDRVHNVSVTVADPE